MKIIIAIKRVIDYQVDIQVKADGAGVVRDGVPTAMNPFDEVALEEAIRLKESGIASHILAVCVGSSACQKVLNLALAMGADEGLLLQADDDTEPLIVAKAMAKLADQRQADLLLFGKQAIDDGANQTGQMTAALMHCGQAVFVSHLVVDKANRRVIATRDTDFGTETLQLSMPAVVTTALRLNEPRFVSLPQMIKAKKKTTTVIPLTSLGIDDTQKRLQVLRLRQPKARQPVVMLDSVEQLAEVITRVTK
ncbi:MAG: hypothetical protein CSA45_02305 [Gammaproteobacteria bacterium]|nr:MAG: hypothetical protein CSA45_02305 [Gammaproteobacteria bacterium]